ncbi:hypothetical protein AB0L57_05790 [Nocardia sp. NPDC052254]|uniref:hypothetical protein n=1 Tax=Nocardia sp. NPDC052254 TaxID=3155681 RepID=UPI003440AD6D
MSYPMYGIPDFSLPTIGSQIGHGLTSLIAGEGIPNARSAADVQGMYNGFRDGVRSEVSKIGFEGEFRPPSVHDTDNFERHDLATLRAKVDKIDLTAVAGLKNAWSVIGTQETTSLSTFQQAMTKATDENVWRGEASKAAAQAVTDYTTKSSQVAKAAELTGNKLDELSTGLTPTKDLVPHVPEHRSGVGNFRHWLAGRGWKNDDTAYHNAYAEAKRVLSTVYAPVVHESDAGVPVIPKPNQPPNGPGDQPPPSTVVPPDGSRVPGQVDPGGTDNSPNQNPDEQNSVDEGPNSPSDPSASSEPSSSPNAGDRSPADPAAATTAAGFDPSSLAKTGTGSSVPGGLGGGTPGSPGQGNAVPGVAGLAADAGNAGRAAAAAGKSGTSGVPGMGGMGRGKGDKEDERTKTAPDYLINQENGDELTGIPALPKSVPPVIGG